jgi:hypothetical protein
VKLLPEFTKAPGVHGNRAFFDKRRTWHEIKGMLHYFTLTASHYEYGIASYQKRQVCSATIEVFSDCDSHLSLSLLPLDNKNKMASSDNLLPQNSRIVQPAFLEKHSNKVRFVSWIDYRLMPTVEAGYSFLCRVVSYRVVSCLLSVSHSLLHHTHILTSYIISCYLFVIHRKTWSNVSAH